MLSIDEALDAIRNAPDRNEAARIRNDVCTEVMHRKRPESDDPAARNAFFERWGDTPQYLGEAWLKEKLHWTGD